jgi:hypothetical protein
MGIDNVRNSLARRGSRGEPQASSLRLAAIDEEFGPSDKARVVGREKHGRLGDLVRIPDAAHRNQGSQIIK